MFRLLILGTVAALAACGDNVEPVPAKPAATEAAAPALSADPTAAVPATATIPPNFQGEWNATLADCGTGRNDSRLRVAADRVVFYESSGTVRSVEQHAEDELSVFLERAAEGQVTRWERRWRLADEGAILQDMTDGSGLVRHRCPAAKS